MRGREFTMKDAYSFDRDDAGGMRATGDVRRLQRIFTAWACGSAPWRPTPATSAARRATSSR
jgi:prolyl-tRNA synthetase